MRERTVIQKAVGTYDLVELLLVETTLVAVVELLLDIVGELD